MSGSAAFATPVVLKSSKLCADDLQCLAASMGESCSLLQAGPQVTEGQGVFRQQASFSGIGPILGRQHSMECRLLTSFRLAAGGMGGGGGLSQADLQDMRKVMHMLDHYAEHDPEAYQ